MNNLRQIEQLQSEIRRLSLIGANINQIYNSDKFECQIIVNGIEMNGGFVHLLKLNSTEQTIKDFFNSYGADIAARKLLLEHELSQLFEKSA